MTQVKYGGRVYPSILMLVDAIKKTQPKRHRSTLHREIRAGKLGKVVPTAGLSGGMIKRKPATKKVTS